MHGFLTHSVYDIFIISKVMYEMFRQKAMSDHGWIQRLLDLFNLGRGRGDVTWNHLEPTGTGRTPYN